MYEMSDIETKVLAELKSRITDTDTYVGMMLELGQINAENNYTAMLQFLHDNPKADAVEMFDFIDDLVYEIID